MGVVASTTAEICCGQSPIENNRTPRQKPAADRRQLGGRLDREGLPQRTARQDRVLLYGEFQLTKPALPIMLYADREGHRLVERSEGPHRLPGVETQRESISRLPGRLAEPSSASVPFAFESWRGCGRSQTVHDTLEADARSGRSYLSPAMRNWIRLLNRKASCTMVRRMRH